MRKTYRSSRCLECLFIEGERRRFRAPSGRFDGAVGCRFGRVLLRWEARRKEKLCRPDSNLVVVSRAARRAHPRVEVVRNEVEDVGFGDIRARGSDSPSPAATIAIDARHFGPGIRLGIVIVTRTPHQLVDFLARFLAVGRQYFTKLVVKLESVLDSSSASLSALRGLFFGQLALFPGSLLGDLVREFFRWSAMARVAGTASWRSLSAAALVTAAPAGFAAGEASSAVAIGRCPVGSSPLELPLTRGKLAPADSTSAGFALAVGPGRSPATESPPASFEAGDSSSDVERTREDRTHARPGLVVEARS